MISLMIGAEKINFLMFKIYFEPYFTLQILYN